MPKTVTIEVTADDISNGVCISIWDCAVATACARVGRELGYSDIAVDGQFAYFDKDKSLALRAGFRVELPARVQAWIKDFDNKRPVEPFSFELAVPDP